MGIVVLALSLLFPGVRGKQFIHSLSYVHERCNYSLEKGDRVLINATRDDWEVLAVYLDHPEHFKVRIQGDKSGTPFGEEFSAASFFYLTGVTKRRIILTALQSTQMTAEAYLIPEDREWVGLDTRPYVVFNVTVSYWSEAVLLLYPNDPYDLVAGAWRKFYGAANDGTLYSYVTGYYGQENRFDARKYSVFTNKVWDSTDDLDPYSYEWRCILQSMGVGHEPFGVLFHRQYLPSGPILFMCNKSSEEVQGYDINSITKRLVETTSCYNEDKSYFSYLAEAKNLEDFNPKDPLIEAVTNEFEYGLYVAIAVTAVLLIGLSLMLVKAVYCTDVNPDRDVPAEVKGMEGVEDGRIRPEDAIRLRPNRDTGGGNNQANDTDTLLPS
jgi:hypothetical protein